MPIWQTKLTVLFNVVKDLFFARVASNFIIVILRNFN